MDNAEFEKQLTECKETLERISMEAKEVSEKLCGLIEEHEGEKGEWYWSCRTMTTDIDDVLNDTSKRLKRYQEGDRTELPQVLIMAIECCERLQDTADLCMAGKQGERRDLKGQISSNIGYLAQHLESMKEDEYLPDDAPDFREFKDLAKKAVDQTASIEELTGFICSSLRPLHEYLNGLRRDAFWEEREY